jgi:hypothetical protein
VVVDRTANLLDSLDIATQKAIDCGLVITSSLGSRSKEAHLSPGHVRGSIGSSQGLAHNNSAPAFPALLTPIADFRPWFTTAQHLIACNPEGTLNVSVLLLKRTFLSCWRIRVKACDEHLVVVCSPDLWQWRAVWLRPGSHALLGFDLLSRMHPASCPATFARSSPLFKLRHNALDITLLVLSSLLEPSLEHLSLARKIILDKEAIVQVAL